MTLLSRNPYTGAVLETFAPHTPAQVDAKLAQAERCFQDWRRLSFQARGDLFNRAAVILETQAPRWAELMTLEMGKPYSQALAEVKKCAWVCRFYAEQAPLFLADEPAETDAQKSWICYQPLGAVLAVMPWNFPFWQVFRFAAPALMAGNVGLLKHASNVPQCALALETIFREAGFPQGAFQTLLISGAEASALMTDLRVQAAALTGSEAAGASLAQAAGAEIKKVVLELGGSDPFIVLESADLDLALASAVPARMQNNGQSCIAAKRFIVVESLAEEFFGRLSRAFTNLKIGDPRLEDTEIGPLATEAIREELHQQVKTTLDAGAKLLTGGVPLPGAGYFYPPTLLIDIPPTAPTYRQEFFGPVALGFRVPDLEAAIALANDVPFGLGACAWTQDPEEQEICINELQAGAVFINSMVKSDPRLPFGGIKRSGIGRELGRLGILEFVNAKTVWLA
ncbi:MAG: NAD-dependent succinate-semialdehyde dehydrogenase [Cyanobacteriota bacterium]|nr:NAD-dependent succinate-semialdehyde dehydrogenase [Cyanobacteriota bacterium]